MLGRLTFMYALSRAAFGAGSLVAPGAVFRRTAGDVADRPATQSFIRTFGIRDVVLGAELARAARDGDGVRRWLLLSGVCGAVDFLALAAARDDLPEASREMLALTAMDALSGFGLAALSR
jgi:hypothetical protein